METERTDLDKLSTRREKCQKKFEDFMTDFYNTGSKKVNQVFTDEGGDLKMSWTSAPYYMAELQPARECPKMVYMAYRRLLSQSTKEINAEGLSTMLRRYGESLDPVTWMNFRDYVFRIAQHVEKRKSDPHYTRLLGLIDASRIMREDHQAEFHRLLFSLQYSEELKNPFGKSVAKAVDKIKQGMLNKPHVPFGALGMSQRHEVAHVFHRNIPESRYSHRGRNQTRLSQRGRFDQRRSRPYDRDYRDRERPHRDRQSEDTAPRGSNRSRRPSRGERRRGRGSRPQQQQNKETPKEKVDTPKPSKQAVWKHSDKDREAVLEAFDLQDN